MNWLFWKGAHSSLLDPCDTIEPLLALYADQMASPMEGRRVDAHLQECLFCRDTLLWMQATRKTLASRPVALPPADLRARIAEAIAASDGVPAQTPRVFKLRPAYAAAASLTALAVFLIGHSLYAPHPAIHTVTNAPRMVYLPPLIAPAHTIIPTLKIVPAVKHPLSSSRHDESMSTLPKAFSMPSAYAPKQSMPHVILSLSSRPRTLTVALTVLHPLATHPQKQSMIMALKPSAPKSSDHISLLTSPAPTTQSTEVASKTAPQAITVGTPKIFTQEPAPSILVASSNHISEVHIQTDSLLGSVQDYALKHSSNLERHLSLASNKAIHGAVYRTAMTSGLESPVSFADIHSP